MVLIVLRYETYQVTLGFKAKNFISEYPFQLFYLVKFLQATQSLHAASFYGHNRTPSKLLVFKQQFTGLQFYQWEGADWIINATTLSCEQLSKHFPKLCVQNLTWGVSGCGCSS